MRKSLKEFIQSKNGLNWTILGAAGIVLLTIAVYLPVIHCGFVWDDDANVTEDLTLRSLRGLWQIWTNPLANQQYYPLTHTSFWIEYHLWGLKPLGYHVDNVILHAIGAVLLWFVLRRLAIPGAWLAAAIFAVHPLQVESVAWVTERKNTLSGVFYFSALLAYLHYAGIGEVRRAGNLRVYALALGLFICALLSKTATSTLPVALLIIVWWKHDRLTRRHVFDLVPLFALGFGMGQMTARLEKFHGAVGEAWSLPVTGKLIVAGKALAFYAGKLFWPVGLIHIYPRWRIDPGDLRQYAFPLMAVAVPAGLWLLRKRIGKTPLVAVLFFEATLAPALGFFNVYFMKYSFVQDHFQYLAGIGLIALAAGLLTVATRRFPELSFALPAVVLLLLGTSARQQIPKYKDEKTLWSVTIAKNPSAWIGRNNLGILLAREGRYDEAIAQYRKVMALEPEFSDVYINMGVALVQKGQMDRAAGAFQQAIKLSPRNPGAHYCLGELLASQGRYGEARAHYEAALRLDPKMEGARAGLDLVKQGKRRSPQPDAQDHYKQGVRLEGEGDIEGAMSEYQKAIRLDPDLAEAHFSLGVILDNRGEIGKAIKEYLATVRIKPSMVSAHNNLAVAYYSQRDGENAWKEVKLCRKYGYEPSPDFLAALAQLMPEP